jgi:hypothetical protein
MARLSVDHSPKNGKTSANPKVTNPGKSVPPSAHMPESGARSRPGGQFSAGGKAGTPKADAKGGTLAAHSGASAPERGNHPQGSHVPRGEHHGAGQRAPSSHAEFHSLGHPTNGKY